MVNNGFVTVSVTFVGDDGVVEVREEVGDGSPVFGGG